MSILIGTKSVPVGDKVETLNFHQDGSYVHVTRTGTEYKVTVNALDFQDWQRGKKIQHAMSDLSPDQREFLMSGYTAEEWDDLWAEESGDQPEPDDNCTGSYP